MHALCCCSVYGGGSAHTHRLHTVDICLLMVVYQGVCKCMQVCVGYVFSVVGTLILLSQPRCATWCYETWPPHHHHHPAHTPTIAAPSPLLSSKPAQNSALRHMWKQFSQCPEQGSPHTHKQTYIHTSLIHTQDTHSVHTHPSHIVCADIHTPSIRSHVTLICPLLRCSLHGIWQCVNSTMILNCYQVVYTQSVNHVYPPG